MDLFSAIILSIIEGITEFLPISSTGHMILSADLLNVPESEFLKSFEIIIQLGAILAVVSMYLKILLTRRDLWIKLLAAFIPTGIAGFVLYPYVKQYLLGNSVVVLWSLFLGGIVLIIWEIYYQRKTRSEIPPIKKVDKRDLGGGKIEDLSLNRAFVIGVFQAISIVPGVSRAAATIIGAMTVGLSRRAAVEFSFLLAVPTMAAATGLDLVKSNFSFNTNEWVVLAVGFIGAFVTAMLAVKFFLKFVEHNTFIPFGIYRIVLAVLFWVFIMR